MQQSLCKISSVDSSQLFSGFKCMGNTDTVFTYRKKWHEESTKTVENLHRAIQGILLPDCFQEIGIRSPTQSTFKLDVIKKQEIGYLDGFLNLDHCSELDLTKKRKKDDHTVGRNTAVSGLTNISPLSTSSAGTTWLAIATRTLNNSQRNASTVITTVSQTHLDSLELENQMNKCTINDMNQQLADLKKLITSLTELQKKATDELSKWKEWQDTISKQMATMLQVHNNRMAYDKEK